MKDRECDMFKYAEKCLYDYKRNVACLELLRSDLRLERSGTDVHAQNYQYAFNFTGTPANPVEARLLRIERIEERILQLERCTQPISRMIEDLQAPYVHEGSAKADMYPLMELYYFGQNSLTLVLSELHISKPILYKRRRILVRMLMGYMGYL